MDTTDGICTGKGFSCVNAIPFYEGQEGRHRRVQHCGGSGIREGELFPGAWTGGHKGENRD